MKKTKKNKKLRLKESVQELLIFVLMCLLIVSAVVLVNARVEYINEINIQN